MNFPQNSDIDFVILCAKANCDVEYRSKVDAGEEK